MCGICCVTQQRLDTAHLIYSFLGHNNSTVISAFIFSTFTGVGKGPYPELDSLLTTIWISPEMSKEGLNEMSKEGLNAALSALGWVARWGWAQAGLNDLGVFCDH